MPRKPPLASTGRPRWTIFESVGDPEADEVLVSWRVVPNPVALK
jgi:hypothetical protein